MLFIFMFSMAFMVFFLVFKHTLSSLISLEFMALAIFFLLIISPLFFNNEMYSSFLYISIVVCEAALGLSMIVLFVRKKGNDLFNMY